MINFINNFFSKSVTAKDKINIQESEYAHIKKANREFLNLVDNWIDEQAFKTSFFSYGVPDFIKDDINKPIGNETTYTDIMVYLMEKYFTDINYFEIGVSVGKNFFQVMNSTKNVKMMGFDIEEINPILESKLSLKSRSEWQTISESIKTNRSSLKRYTYNNKEVSYLSGDVWDENTWSKLAGNKFNVVFSDALHTPQAILFEFEMLVKYDLLDQKFIIVWDDLVGKMKNSFFKIIRKYDKIYDIQDVYLLNINGWIGEHEPPHTVGMISNFKL